MRGGYRVFSPCRSVFTLRHPEQESAEVANFWGKFFNYRLVVMLSFIGAVESLLLGIYTLTCTRIHLHTPSLSHTYTLVHTQAHAHAHTRTRTHTHARTHARTHVRTHTCTHAHIHKKYMNTNFHAYVHPICIHT